MEIKISNLDLTSIKPQTDVERLFIDSIHKFSKEVFIKNALKKSFEELNDDKYRQAVYKIYDEVLKGHLQMYPNLLNYVPKIDVEVVGDPKDRCLKVSIMKI